MAYENLEVDFTQLEMFLQAPRETQDFVQANTKSLIIKDEILDTTGNEQMNMFDGKVNMELTMEEAMVQWRARDAAKKALEERYVVVCCTPGMFAMRYLGKMERLRGFGLHIYVSALLW